MPDAAVLLSWAEELGIPIGSPAEDEAGVAGDAPPTGEARSVGRARTTSCARSLVKGFAVPEQLAVALGVRRREPMTDIVDRLCADGLAEASAGSFRLTADGKTVATGLLERDAQALGPGGGERRARRVHRARPPDEGDRHRLADAGRREQQVRTTTADAAYDAAVLARLGVLHDDARAWLEGCIAGLPRLVTYLHRLDHAARLAAEGDGKYVASPRVDSYHGVWFELHEDLILLAGRTRADEVAAGRA